MRTPGNYRGLVFLAKKNGSYLSSECNFMRESRKIHGPFNQMVPGRIGDPNAGYDPSFSGAGWLYIDDPDYIVYSSLDYSSQGVDITGSNYNDWPIRLVDHKRTYVADPSVRAAFPPVFRSDEDLFCVFKDTDARADPIYGGVNGPSVPIGVEIRNSIMTWGDGPGKDIVLFEYEIVNKGRSPLDSCILAFCSGIQLGGPRGATVDPEITISRFQEDSCRNLVYERSADPSHWSDWWFATPSPPTIGYTLLSPPTSNTTDCAGLLYGGVIDTVWLYSDGSGGVAGLSFAPTDSIVYHAISHPPQCTLPPWNSCTRDGEAFLVTKPFSMEIGSAVVKTFAILFSDSLSHLLLMHDYITRVYNNNFTRPAPPPTPQLTAVGLNRSVKLSWDNTAESATDVIIPDSLGRPFVGYKLLRGTTRDGPYTELARWHADTLLVYEYLDTGEDLEGGLKNNVTYYYQLLSYDEGAPLLKLDPMDSPPVEGVNFVEVIPTTEPSDATSESSDGSVVDGTLGAATAPVLIPRNTTNFNRLLSGRDLTLRLSAASNGLRYTLPVTITDSISGRVHNDVVDPELLVHGSSETAGLRSGTAIIEDVFDIGAADITFDYSFEQLGDPFHVASSIEGSSDCPIIIGDSLGTTGLQLSSPYTSAAQELYLEFSQGGIDTISTIFQRYLPYLTVNLIDAVTGEPYTGSWSFTPKGARRTGTITFNPPSGRKYYLTGTLSNGEEWDFGALLELYNWAIAFDFPDRGIGSGKSGPAFPWGSQGVAGTVDFSAGDRVRLSWEGGVRGVFPDGAVRLTGAPAGRTDVTQEMMEGIRIVPNPYFIRHEAQRSNPELYFNYLPEECTIRIYTVSLDLVKTIEHTNGSRAVWDLTTEGGQLVASQMLIAHIEAGNGVETIKKFAVVVGK